MSSLPINIVDLIVFVVLLLSALLALFRGFTKEVLSIVGWVAALAVTYFFFPLARDLSRTYIESRLFADIAAGIALFLPTLILCSILTHWISEQVRRASAISAVDRSLGFLFGLARGALIVVIAFWVIDRMIPEPTRPTWLKEAKTWGPAQIGFEWGAEMILRQIDPTRVPPKRTTGPQTTPVPAHTSPGGGADSRGQTGYKTEERQGIESLIQKQDKP